MRTSQENVRVVRLQSCSDAILGFRLLEFAAKFVNVRPAKVRPPIFRVQTQGFGEIRKRLVILANSIMRKTAIAIAVSVIGPIGDRR